MGSHAPSADLAFSPKGFTFSPRTAYNMRMKLTIQLPDHVGAELVELSARKQSTKVEVIRRAIMLYALLDRAVDGRKVHLATVTGFNPEYEHQNVQVQYVIAVP